jgi:hypothetical protein
VLAQTDSMPRKRKSAADDFPTKRQRTSPRKDTIEKWLAAVPPTSNQTRSRSEPGRGELRTRPEAQPPYQTNTQSKFGIGLRKRLNTEPRTQRLQSVQNTLEPTLSAFESSPSPSPKRKRRGTSEVRKRLKVDLQPHQLTQNALDDLESPESEETSMSRSVSETQSETSVGPTDPDYESRLRARKIYTERTTVEPSNLGEVKAALAATRDSPEPDDITAKKFRRRVQKSGNEGGAMQALLPQLLPIIDRYWDSENDAFSIDQQWDRYNLPEPDVRPLLKPPKPDQAFGFTPQTFPFPQASLCLKSAMSPARDIAWPYCTIEIKGRQGQLNIARLQNSLNGAVMMNNMLELKRMLGKEDELLGQIIVVTMELTTESISLCGQFTTRNTTGDLERDSLCLFCASALDPNGDAFKSSYRQSMNMVEAFRGRTLKWITEDMATLEEKLAKQMLRGLGRMTPPASHRDRSPSRGSSRSTARSLTRRKSNLSNLLGPADGNQSDSGAQDTNKIQ